MRLDYVARPAGSKPAAVYWRRRAIVAGVLLLLVWFAAKACGGPGPSTHAADSSSVHPDASSTPSGRGTPAKSGAPSAAAVGTPGGTSPASDGGSGASTSPAVVTAMCDASSLSLRAAVDRLNFRRPFTAAITLQIGTRAPSPCGLDAGALQAQVLDGSRVLWSSGGCPDAGAATTAGTTGTGVSASGGAVPGSTGTSAASSGTDSGTSPAGAAAQNVLAVPSQAAADQRYTWHGDVCSGQLAPGRYDVVGRLGLAEAFAGTVTIS